MEYDVCFLNRSAAGAAVGGLTTEDGKERRTKMEKMTEQRLRERTEQEKEQNQLLHAIFTMNKLQAKVALTMVMYGADIKYSVASAVRCCPEN